MATISCLIPSLILRLSMSKKVAYSLLYFTDKREAAKQEIVAIVAIPGIGRVRARRLYDAGFRSISDISRASPSQLESLRGFSNVLAQRTIDYAGRLVRRNAAD